MATVIIPTPLRKFTDAQAKLSIPGSSVGEIISNLISAHPSVSNYLLDGQGKIRAFVNVFLGEDDIRNLKNQETEVSTEATISIVPAIAGG